MSGIHADLHMHTVQSDGQLTLDEVPDVAKEAGVSAVAITDHDRVHPDINKPAITRDGVDIINGIELRVEPEELDERIDLLGYGVTATDSLQDMVNEIQTNREERGQEIVSRIEDLMDVTLDIDIGDNIGRPHIARAVDAHSEIEYTYEEAFEELIGRDCPCYVSRDIPSFDDGLTVLRNACNLVSLAHPFRYNEPMEAMKLTNQLDAIECIYPYGERVPYPHLDEYTTELFELIMTGGSDAHDKKSVGTAGLTETHYDMFLDEANLRNYTE